jgi:uncharacterized membrane protein YbaN (DUF454 family)
MKLAPVQSKAAKLIYLLTGLISLIIGVIGLLLPVLPGWLFLIPAFLCFAKVSPTLNKWVKKRKTFHKYFSEI